MITQPDIFDNSHNSKGLIHWFGKRNSKQHMTLDSGIWRWTTTEIGRRENMG